MKLNCLRNMNPSRFSESRTKYAARFEIRAERTAGLEEKLCFMAHSHPYIEVIYVKGGSIDIECGSARFCAGPGELVIFNPYEPHFGVVGADSLYAEYTVFNFDIGRLSGLLSPEANNIVTGLVSLDLRFQNHLPASPAAASIGARIDEILEASQNGASSTGTELVRLGIATCIIGALLSEFPLESNTSRLRHNRFTQAVVDFTEANYARQIAPDELPSLLKLSRSHFCALFGKNFGMPYSSYLRDLRLDKALEIIGRSEYSEMNISEIARAVGFTNYSYFARCFKRKYGVSMSEYLMCDQPNEE